jgi:hypothetical protein
MPCVLEVGTIADRLFDLRAGQARCGDTGTTVGTEGSSDSSVRETPLVDFLRHSSGVQW